MLLMYRYVATISTLVNSIEFAMFHSHTINFLSLSCCLREYLVMMMSFRSSHICAKRSFHCLFSSSVNCVPRIVFENNHALIIDKPAGISHHSSGEENGIMKNMRVLQKSDPSIYGGDLFSVHRLDRDTSGLLLFAKTKFAASFFSKEFADRKVVKYCTLVFEMILFSHSVIEFNVTHIPCKYRCCYIESKTNQENGSDQWRHGTKQVKL